MPKPSKKPRRRVKPVAPAPRVEPFRRSNKTLRALDPRWTVPVDPASRVVGVRAVYRIDAVTLGWTFDVPAMADEVVPQLEASPDGVTYYPATALGGSFGGQLLMYYEHDGLDLPETCYYRIVAAPLPPPQGLSLASGRLAVPLTGLAVPPPPATQVVTPLVAPAPAPTPARRRAA